jgi:hypothetical protein
MKETVGPVSTCGRELLRGWWRSIGLMASFMCITASVRNILDTPSYKIVDWVVQSYSSVLRSKGGHRADIITSAWQPTLRHDVQSRVWEIFSSWIFFCSRNRAINRNSRYRT